MGPLGGTGGHRSASGGSLVPESVQKALLLMHLPKAKSAGKGNVKNRIFFFKCTSVQETRENGTQHSWRQEMVFTAMLHLVSGDFLSVWKDITTLQSMVNAKLSNLRF